MHGEPRSPCHALTERVDKVERIREVGRKRVAGQERVADRIFHTAEAFDACSRDGLARATKHFLADVETVKSVAPLDDSRSHPPASTSNLSADGP